MQAKRRPNHVTQSQIPTISQQLAMLKQSKHKPPVMRKMSKEGSLGKQPNNSQVSKRFGVYFKLLSHHLYKLLPLLVIKPHTFNW